MADVLLYPARRDADVHRSGHQLQLRRAKHRPLQKDAHSLCPVRRGADGRRHADLRFSAVTAAADIYLRCARDRDRHGRLPHHRPRLYPDGHIADLSGVLSGGGLKSEKLGAHGDPDSRAVRPARLSFLPLRAEPVLADVSGYGDPDEHRGGCILPAVPQKGLCQRAEAAARG